MFPATGEVTSPICALDLVPPDSEPTPEHRVGTILFAATILISAFLLFQIQPLIAKLILPWFGGSAAVWATCMVFFQVSLVAGYGYAHWLNGQGRNRQAAIHLGLLALSALSLPVFPSPLWKPYSPEDPLLRILGLLTASIGLPYFLLSSTSPLLQSWYARSAPPSSAASSRAAAPYRLFALSNVGSMLGLLTYPVLVEPWLTGRQQVWIWSLCYAAFALLCAVVTLRLRAAPPVMAAAISSPRVRWSERLIWISLPACASALLLAVTNHITQNIAAIPFLWVLPLSLYLLSFILCFDSERWYQRRLFAPLAALSIPAIAYAVANQKASLGIRSALGFFCLTSFVLFMVCHGELSRRRPAPAYLTSFYLTTSLGGAVGGLLVGFAAPYLFNALDDLPVVVSLTGFLLLYLLCRDRDRMKATDEPSRDSRYDKPVLAALIITSAVLIVWHFGAIRRGRASGLNANVLWWAVGAAIVTFLIWRRRGSAAGSLALLTVTIPAVLAIGTAAFLAVGIRSQNHSSRALVRNFYGALRVYDRPTAGSMGAVRVLAHGIILHGEQFLTPPNQRFAASYYDANSGIGLAFRRLQVQGPVSAGIIGLGAGTLAVYGRPVDRLTFYEINPLVLRIAQTQFSFLSECRAPHEVILGDARLALESGGPKLFDLLVVDAFSGDSIPVHLLTREAFALYWHHLKPGGVLAVHVSNSYLSLGQVASLAAAADNKEIRLVRNHADPGKEIAPSEWALASSQSEFFEQAGIRDRIERIEPGSGLRIWTDDYSNLYRTLR